MRESTSVSTTATRTIPHELRASASRIGYLRTISAQSATRASGRSRSRTPLIDIIFISINGVRLLLRPEARVADWAEIVLKYPIRDAEALSSCGIVRVAVVDTDVDSRIHNLLLQIRKVGEGAGLLQGVRVSRGHLKTQLL